ncbi:hypothetical protein A2U01_0018860, partial [Trifolium medium]|nr:hypothetical protein [Trifolium medium]
MGQHSKETKGRDPGSDKSSQGNKANLSSRIEEMRQASDAKQALLGRQPK